jgi:hypothetical protein
MKAGIKQYVIIFYDVYAGLETYLMQQYNMKSLNHCWLQIP